MFKQNHFDGASGTALTAASQTAATGSDAFDSLYQSGLTLSFDSAQKMHGTTSLKLDTPTSGTSSSQAQWAFTAAPITTISYRFYVRMSSLPSAAMGLMYISAAGGKHTIAIDQNGRFSWIGPVNGNIPTSTLTAAVNTWYRVEGTIVVGTGTSGSVSLKVFAGDSTTALGTANTTGIATSTDGSGITYVQFGKVTSSPVIGDYWIDDPAISDSATAIGPYVPGNPSVIASASLSGSALSLSSVAVTYDNAAPTYSWTKVSGPAVTLSGASSASASATLTTAGDYVFRVTVTDDLNHTDTDDVAVTYAGSVSAPTVGTTQQFTNAWVESIPATPGASGALSYAISPSGPTQIAPGVFTGTTPTTAQTFTVTITEAGNPNTTQYQFTVPGTPTAAGGVRILLASDDSTAGGSFS